MYTARCMRQYHQQAVAAATPEQLVLKLYDLALASVHRNDRAKLRAVLVELVGSLNLEGGGELAARLHALYTYCIEQSAQGDLAPLGALLEPLRDAWRQGVVEQRPAASFAA